MKTASRHGRIIDHDKLVITSLVLLLLFFCSFVYWCFVLKLLLYVTFLDDGLYFIYFVKTTYK